MATKYFALTVFNTFVPKSIIFKCLEHICSELILAEEDCVYKYTTTESKVHRIYMCTIVGLFQYQIEQMLKTIYFEQSKVLSSQIQTSNSTHSCFYEREQNIVIFEDMNYVQIPEYIKEITYYDLNALRKNVYINEMSIGCQIIDWLRGTNRILDYNDLFLFQNEELRCFLTELHRHYWHMQHLIDMDMLQRLFITCLNIKA